MAEAPAYVILGRGRWALRMRPIISGEGRSIVSIEETRQRPSEDESQYVDRLATAMKAGGAQIAWLCVAPGPHVSLMIHATIEAGLHVVVEKPWYGSSQETQKLQSLARAKGRVIAVHFEYLVLKEVEQWRAEFYPGAGHRLGGRFLLSRSDRSGIPAIDNLGCHLLAIREYAVPSSDVSEIRCGYELPDERLVWIDKGNQRLASIDLFTHGQPIIQRFMKKVEAALDGAAFPFDLDFALRVAEELNAFKSRGLA
jgi:GFO/IDH/MocA oxidoreductase family protein